MNRDAQQRKNFIWNTAAGLLNAAEAVILSMIVTRTTGLEDAGILTIAFATGNLFSNVGKYGVRNYQATDVAGKYSFRTYFYARLITVAGMALCSAGYVLWGCFVKHYPVGKAACIFVICAIYMAEAAEDVFWGRYQLIGRLDAGAKIFIVRWSGLLVISGVLLFAGSSLFTALSAAFVPTLAADVILIRYANRRLVKGDEEAKKTDGDEIFSLLKVCFPLFVSGFAGFYMINAPKYAIDTYLSDQVQACYGFVSMPVFVISLLNMFLYEPILVQMATEWQEGMKKAVRRRVHRQAGLVAGITLVCEAGAYVLGIPFLSFLYHTELTAYKTDLLLILLGGAGLALTGFFATVLTMMRMQKTQVAIYAVMAVLACFTSRFSVKYYGVRGAVVSYMILSFLTAVIFYCVIEKRLGRKRKEQE